MPEAERDGTEAGSSQPPVSQLSNAVLAEALNDQRERSRLNLPEAEDEALPVIVELNLRYRDGLVAAVAQFRKLYREVIPERPEPNEVDRSYWRCLISVDEARKLASREQDLAFPDRVIYRIWPDFPIGPLHG